MARPTKNNCDYFPHLTTMRNHRKVKALRNKFGQVLGYAFWAMFLEYLTEQDGCEVENSEIELEMFSGELGVSVAEIQEMINYCIRIELLFLNKDNFIYSESLNDNLLPVFEKRKKSKETSKARKRRENGTFIPNNTTPLGVSATETPQSRVEYSKVKKSKVTIPWKNDFSIYLDDLNKSVDEICNDTEWIMEQEKYNPNLDIIATIRKGVAVYWGVETEGYLNKKKSKGADINWKTTFAKNMDKNKVYIPFQKKAESAPLTLPEGARNSFDEKPNQPERE